MKSAIRVVIAFLVIMETISALKLNDAKGGSFKLTILHNNDMHARFEQTGVLSGRCSKNDADNNLCYGGFARVAHKVREFRQRASEGKSPPVLYLNAGDTYTGTPWFGVFTHEITSEFLRILQPDAIVSFPLDMTRDCSLNQLSPTATVAWQPRV